MEQSANRPPERTDQTSEGVRGKVALAMRFLVHPIETVDSFFQGGNGGEITVPGDDVPHDCNRFIPPGSEIKPPQ